MKQKVYSLFDKKANAYLTPVYFNEVGEASRMLATVVQTADNNISRYPEDFSLYQLGTFDQESGKLESLKQPLFVANAVEYKQTDKYSQTLGKKQGEQKNGDIKR